MEIDKDGYLSLTRAGIIKKQMCPMCIGARCGDWCPQFGNADTTIREGGDKTVSLGICQGMELICDFNDYVDERDPR